jgi:hypothetical protein
MGPKNVLEEALRGRKCRPWSEILREAVQAISTQPVVGSRFRVEVDSAASKRSLQFPPPAEPRLRFIELLQRYSNVVSILRRPGQDFLVVPAGKSDLLTKGIQGQLYGIRQDLFQAFTTISINRAYYDKSSDQVFWQAPEEGQAVPDSWVPIEPTTSGVEIQLRRDFAEACEPQPPARAKLLGALSNPQSFLAFGRAVREAGLQREWHSFRTERVLERIQGWARDAQIEWKDAWLTERQTDSTSKNRAGIPSETPAHADADSLQVLFSGLDAADIQRISIPLDLVLKAISESKRR